MRLEQLLDDAAKNIDKPEHNAVLFSPSYPHM